MFYRMLVSLFAVTAILRADEGPGLMLQGYTSHVGKDADGTVWGMHEAPEAQLAALVGLQWESRTVPGLHHESCRSVTLGRFADGDVGCLWRDMSEEKQTWVLTRHRGGKSRIAKRFQATLKEPTMMGLEDGRVFITGVCRTFVTVFPGDKEPQVVTLPEHLFFPPERQPEDRSLLEENILVQVLKDASGTLWLWSSQNRWWHKWRPRLRGPVRVGKTPAELQLCQVGKEGSSLSSLVSWDATHLLAAVLGEGLFLLDKDGAHAKAMPVPDAEAFKYVEQVFYDGVAWYAITTPRPSELETGKEAVFFDPTKPINTLWRHTGGTWKLVHHGLDNDFSFEHSWVRTEAGLFLGCGELAPWFFPVGGAPPRRLASTEDFPLSGVTHMIAADEKHLLLGYSPNAASCLWRLFYDKRTPSPQGSKKTEATTPTTDAQFAANLRVLASPSLDAREAAARTLKSQGAAALPKLRAARATASSDVQWWLDAIIQHIERRSAEVPK